MTDSGVKKVQENKVTIEVGIAHDNPTNSKTFYNPVMQICRELVLSALSVHVDHLTCGEKKVEQVKCLDAFGATGIAGLQWKRHLTSKVEVAINELNPVSVDNILNNCKLNDILGKRSQVPSPAGNNVWDVPNTSRHSTEAERQGCVTEVGLPKEAGGSTGSDPTSLPESSQPSVEVVCGDANVILHSRQHHFIHLDPFGTTIQFLDGAFRNIYNGGVLVLTSTDIAALYGKCKEVLWRNYSARCARSDYTKEMAVRIVISAAARAAARCHKGFTVLYGVVTEHFVQVAVRVQRGARHANSCLTHVNSVLQCQLCQQWAIMPESDKPIESPSSLLPCTCRTETPGVKSLLLGPMWCGGIFDVEFIDKMRQASAQLALGPRVQVLLTAVVDEARCPRRQHELVATSDASRVQGDVTEPAPVEQGQKRKLLSNDGNQCSDTAKRLKLEEEAETLCESSPIFYYILQNRKLKNVDIPKLHRVVFSLRAKGYRASKTHFDHQGIRTDANLSQIIQCLPEHQLYN